MLHRGYRANVFIVSKGNYMSAVVKILFTVNVLFICGYSTASECHSSKTVTPTTGNSRSIASEVKTIDSFISTDRSTEVSKGLYLKSDKAIHPSDDRLVKGPDSPRYLDAVGRLRIEKSNGKANICGGSLVAFTPKQSSRIVVTSLHCLKSRVAVWSTTTKDGKTIKRKIKDIVYTNFESDVAFLLLEDFVDFRDVPPLMLQYNGGSSLNGHMSNGVEFAAAGYSADAEKGKGGTVLTYDVTGDMAARDVGADPIGGVSDDITTFGGASGGAIILSYEVDEDYAPGILEGKQAFLFGVIKGGLTNDFASSNGVEGSNNTRFVTYEKFGLELYDSMIKYNGAVDGIGDQNDDW